MVASDTYGRLTDRSGKIVGSSKDFGISFRVRIGLLHVCFPVMGVVVQPPVQKAAVSEYYMLVVRAGVRASWPLIGGMVCYLIHIYMYTQYTASPHMYTQCTASPHMYTQCTGSPHNHPQ